MNKYIRILSAVVCAAMSLSVLFGFSGCMKVKRGSAVDEVYFAGETTASAGGEVSEKSTAPTETTTKTNRDAVAFAYGSGKFEDWCYPLKSDDVGAARVIAIDNVDYTKALSWEDKANLARLLLEMSNDIPGSSELVDRYFENMKPVQVDFFSYQWERAKNCANQLLDDPEGSKAKLAKLDMGTFDLYEYSLLDVKRIDEAVTKVLKEYGCEYVWKELNMFKK